MIVQRYLGVDVLTAAKQRIRNIFKNGLPVYMGFSGGKDSLVLADVTAKLAQAGEIDISRLRVEFIDEEAIFPCVERIVRQWRDKFLLLGARFDWYCLEVKHFNCLNQLENDESFICWDSTKVDCWIREPPPFAIRSHPLLAARRETYQHFLAKLCDGPHMTGLRVAESVQRRIAVAQQGKAKDLSQRPTIEPIYDWKDVDVWRYLLTNDIEIPEAYRHLYQVGVPVNNLRISQFFSVDTAQILSRISEFYPHLMERILRREPAAYLVSLYWDSEMFRRRSRNRRAIEQKTGSTQRPGEARAKVMALLRGPFPSAGRASLARYVEAVILRFPYIEDKHYQELHDALIAGDPKRRTIRAVVVKIKRDAAVKLAGHKTIVIGRAGNERAAGRPQQAEA